MDNDTLTASNGKVDEIWHKFFNSSIDEYVKSVLPGLKEDDNTNSLFMQDYSNGTLFTKLLNKLVVDLESSPISKEDQFPISGNTIEQQQLPPPLSVMNSGLDWSFTQGLIIGQLSVIVILIFFIKFFIFAETDKKDNNPPAPKTSPLFKRRNTEEGDESDNLTTTLTNSLMAFSTILKRGGEEVKTLSGDNTDNQKNTKLQRSIQIDNILNKTSYDVNLHRSESLDWFNVLIAQIIEQFREEAINKNNILTSLNDFFTNNLITLPDYLDTVKVKELDIGNNFPIFSNCRIENEKQQLEAKIDIDLRDRLALGIETKLLLNYPKKAFAALPISLTVAVIKFHGSLTVSLTRADEFVHPSDNESSNEEIEQKDSNGYFLIFSFSPEYVLEFETSSLIGARSKLENIPKIASIIEYQIKKWFVERCVEPRFQFVKLPSIWPRSKNVREEKNETVT